jgi:hypothetical protein
LNADIALDKESKLAKLEKGRDFGYKIFEGAACCLLADYKIECQSRDVLEYQR